MGVEIKRRHKLTCPPRFPVSDAQLTEAPTVSNVSVAFLEQAELTCSVAYQGSVPPTVLIVKAEGNQSSSL